MWKRHTGHVDVNCDSIREAAGLAKKQLFRTTFPNIPKERWHITSIEEIN